LLYRANQICLRHLLLSGRTSASLAAGLLPPPPATWCRFGRGLSSVHCFAHGNLGKHQWTLAFNCFQQHFSCDPPFWPLVRRSRQFLNVFAGIAQGAERTAIRSAAGVEISIQAAHGSIRKCWDQRQGPGQLASGRSFRSSGIEMPDWPYRTLASPAGVRLIFLNDGNEPAPKRG
jgi:hypothetical protein